MQRFLEVLISLVALIILSPVFLLLAVCIKLNSKGPVFFTQMRIGKNNELFKLYKFRTMKVGTPNVATDKLKGANNYLTATGKFLRKTSLDELPQLINVIKTEMAFVGPRPALYNQYNLKELRTEAGVHALLPGITGWAQINGRDHNDDAQKTYLDKYYLKNKSLKFDIRILFMTVLKVLKADGVAEGGKVRVENSGENLSA